MHVSERSLPSQPGLKAAAAGCGEIGAKEQGFSKTKSPRVGQALIKHCALRSDPLLSLFAILAKTFTASGWVESKLGKYDSRLPSEPMYL
jgi:hypothetical protein